MMRRLLERLGLRRPHFVTDLPASEMYHGPGELVVTSPLGFWPLDEPDPIVIPGRQLAAVESVGAPSVGRHLDFARG